MKNEYVKTIATLTFGLDLVAIIAVVACIATNYLVEKFGYLGAVPLEFALVWAVSVGFNSLLSNIKR